MLALKALVIGLGILILIAMFLIGYGLVKKAEDPDFRFFKQPSTAETRPAETGPVGRLAPFGEIPLGLPEDCGIESTRLHRGGRLVVEVGPSGPCDRVLVVDLPQGRVLGTVRAR